MGTRRDAARAAWEGLYWSEDAPPLDWVEEPEKNEDGDWFIAFGEAGKIYHVTIERVA